MSALAAVRVSHASSRWGRGGALRAARSAALFSLLLGAPALAQERTGGESAAPAESAEPAPAAQQANEASAEGRPVFSLGPIEYHAARGFRFGDSGLTIGGFSTFEIERLDEEPAELAIDSLNFLALYEPVDPLRVFAELEVGGLASWETSGGAVESDPNANFERLYVEYDASNAFGVRFGKFQTPVGRWNLAPAEPFVWTPTQPAILEIGLDEHQTGISVFGSFYPEKRVISYWVYGQIIDAFDVESDEVPAERSVGGRIEYGEARGVWSLGASLLASELDGAWTTTGGVDAKWRATERLELSSELLVSGGDIPERDFWGVFVEAAYSLDRLSPRLSKLYLVGRVEHFDRSGAESTELVDFGLTWLPTEWLNLKAGYRAAIRDQRELGDGFKASISVLF